MLWTVVGSVAPASSPASAVPHLDNRVIIIPVARPRGALGDQTFYTDHLAALASSLQDGMPFRNRLNNSVAKAELIDCTEAMLTPPSTASSKPPCSNLTTPEPRR